MTMIIGTGGNIPADDRYLQTDVVMPAVQLNEHTLNASPGVSMTASRT